MRHQKNVQMDDKFRICLGSFLSKEERERLSSFRIQRQNDGKIILDPMVEIPAREHWIYKNKKALDDLIKGIEDAKAGRLKDRGSFAQYAKEE